MALNPKLREQIQKMSGMSDEYRENLMQTLEEAPPDLQNLWMSREEYTREKNAFKAEQADWKAKADDFYEKSNKNIAAWQKERDEAIAASRAAQARIAELEGGNGGVRTPAEEDAVAKEVRAMKETIAKLEERFTTVVTPDALEKAKREAAGYMGEQFLDIAETQARHLERTGKRLDKAAIAELVTFTNDKGKELGHPISLEEGYSLRFKEDIEKEREREIEKRVEERLKTQRSVPSASGPSGSAPAEMGPLQIRLREETNRANGAKDGVGFRDWKEAAAAAADELVKEGKY